MTTYLPVWDALSLNSGLLLVMEFCAQCGDVMLHETICVKYDSHGSLTGLLVCTKCNDLHCCYEKEYLPALPLRFEIKDQCIVRQV